MFGVIELLDETFKRNDGLPDIWSDDGATD